MAIRKEAVKKQFEEVVGTILQPGEGVVAGAYTVTGSPLFASGLFGLLGILLAGTRYYWMTVTDRRVLFLGASMMSSRPKGGIKLEDGRSTVRVENATPRATWSTMRYVRPQGKPMKLNFARPWREEMQAIATALGTPSVPPAP